MKNSKGDPFTIINRGQPAVNQKVAKGKPGTAGANKGGAQVLVYGQTRHLVMSGGKWTDRLGNAYPTPLP